MASIASGRILFASIAITCLIHFVVLSVPLQGKALARPIQFQLGKVQWHTAPANEQKSRHPWTLKSTGPTGNTNPSLPTAPDQPTPTESPAILFPEQPQDIAWLPLESRFYTAAQLSKRPKVIEEVDLETAETRSVLATGKMIFNLLIDASGKVIAVDVEQTDLPEIFTRAASNAFMQFKFLPGELDGTPVGSILRIEITYDDAQLPSGENTN